MRVFITALCLCALLTGCSALSGSKGSKRDRTYEVKAGDTLQSIGSKFDVTSEDLQAYNGIRDAKSLKPGQRIVIPAAGPLGRVADRATDTAGQNRAQLRMISLAPVRSYVGELEFPVTEARYSSRFGWRWSKFHEGLDLSAPEGTPVLSAHDGVVVLETDSWGGYGKVIVIKGDKLMTVYGHNSVNQVKKGARVKRGQQIAKVGQTGDASGPHLHFETRVLDENGRYAAVNPNVFYPR
jgi:murein DD-endopeptidase MepM/ murein hydrolase activator NlpD